MTNDDFLVPPVGELNAMPFTACCADTEYSQPKVQSMVQAALRLPESEPALIKATQYREQLSVNLDLRGQVEG